MYNSRLIGTEYEKKAAEYLLTEGYEILNMNYRVRAGEIDIVAKHGKYLVFVEVKYRSNSHKGMPQEAVDIRKQRQICRVALYYLKQYKYPTDVPVRFDVITVHDGNISHIENAFEYVSNW